MSRTSTLLVVSLLVACSSSPAPAPSTPAPAPGLVSIDQTVALRTPIESLPDTGVMGRLRADMLARRRASERAATIIARPDTLRLRVGEAIAIPYLDVVGLDSTGTPIQGFGPAFLVRDQKVAALRGGRLMGLAPGITELVVGRPVTDAQTGRPSMHPMTRIVLVVLGLESPS